MVFFDPSINTCWDKLDCVEQVKELCIPSKSNIAEDKISVLNFTSTTDVAITRLGSLLSKYREISTR